MHVSGEAGISLYKTHKCIVPFNRGFIIGGENGSILAYEKIDDPKIHYKTCG